jgi:hypothetical protein
MQQKTLFKLESVEKRLLNIHLSLAEYLRTYHVGRQSAIVSRELRQFGSGVEIRELVHKLRVEGVPICSCSDGYYFASDSAEVFATVKSLQSRINNISKAHSGLLDTYYELKTDEVTQR